MRRFDHISRNTAKASGPASSGKRGGQRGVSVLEFALVILPMVLLLFGVVVVGVDLSSAIQVAQICRDADAMFSRGVPFYSTASQNFLIQLGQSLNLQSSGGNGLIILSEIQFLPDPSCGTPTSTTYANCTVGTNVLVQRIYIGNTSITGSATRFPTAGAVTYNSLDQVDNYTTDPNAVISNFSSALQLKPLEESYVAEAYFQTNSISLGSIETSPGIYAQAFF